MERFKKREKTVPTIPPTHESLIPEIHKQERLRYQQPHLPFSYTLENKQIIVGPTVRNKK
jgi:hypothetical protein